MNSDDIIAASTSKLSGYYSNSRSSNEKITLTWKNISYTVIQKDSIKSTFFKPVYKNKHILRFLIIIYFIIYHLILML